MAPDLRVKARQFMPVFQDFFSICNHCRVIGRSAVWLRVWDCEHPRGDHSATRGPPRWVGGQCTRERSMNDPLSSPSGRSKHFCTSALLGRKVPHPLDFFLLFKFSCVTYSSLPLHPYETTVFILPCNKQQTRSQDIRIIAADFVCDSMRLAYLFFAVSLLRSACAQSPFADVPECAVSFQSKIPQLGTTSKSPSFFVPFLSWRNMDVIFRIPHPSSTAYAQTMKSSYTPRSVCVRHATSLISSVSSTHESLKERSA